ncbi:tRNA 2-thiouridine(34) synthase MnmA [Allostreptomyces psammosilenae]|uniref:tRNA-specific 2-thiouridylase MnmA n=1 Tax=Allostreptomyces psammosilenae TaxID=1892865 RepID=A0A852ZVY0_9ACTN|nr:tRNA 2-thiouridine(34) synthase MnmA [Allostreptomyces psammosilenae]NYI06536.1 tRNA-specific 2-thiouridylase [Allostreptomyces psammosilenae]
MSHSPASQPAPADRPAGAPAATPAGDPAARTAGGTTGRPLRVLAAMSGGVDSAVAAARAVEAGHDVTGVHLALSTNPQSFRTGARGCCTLEDSRDARRAADVIGIPFYVWDLAERFRQDVVEDFYAEYAAGRTPNPCLRCNEKIKFAALLDRALALGFDAVCTGHYARVVERTGADGTVTRELHRAVDPGKDQSYVLGVLDAEQLAHAMFPLGDTTKDAVREEAERRGLAVARKPDSHDICFIADGDTQGFLARRLGSRPGAIVDTEGRQVGTHEGTHGFTVGQRRGLRIGTPAPDGKPRYVLDISPVDNTVTVGPADALDVTALTGIRPRWCGTPPVGSGSYTAQLRAHGEEVPVTAEFAADAGELRVTLQRPARGIAPGQAVVLYDGTRVVGSATIDRTRRRPEEPAPAS